MWLAVRKRAIDSFTEAMRSFVGRCRQRAWSVDDLVQRAIQRKMDPEVSGYEIEFYRIGRLVYEEYLTRLKHQKLEDFNGIMLRAAKQVRDGTVRFERKGNAGDIRDIDYLHIDEYQDFSRSFYDLTSAMRAANRNMTVFAVGDDWQAINGFAGSDLQYFHNFDEHFADAQHLSSTRNYRSQTRIVEASNALLSDDDRPSEAIDPEPGIVQVCNLDEVKPTPIELEILSARESDGYSAADEYEIAVARVAQWLAKEGEVAFLNRTRDPDAIAGNSPRAAQAALRELLATNLRENITVDTAHSFKGLESDAIVILDAMANHYPLIHPHWIFGRIFGDTVESITMAELRLFYVAVSRARAQLIICTQASKRSPFLDEIQSNCNLAALDLNELLPVVAEISDLYEVRVFNSYEVWEQLKDEGFTFVDHADTGRRHCTKVMSAEEVTLEWIETAPWNNGNVRTEVYDDTNRRIWSSDDGDASALAQAEPF
ncbi:MAG: UvrD-helicase domain-containing protein [Acidimicrobiaceae bacterium]|nr:UvrD-helicase domain-containing protein [Acidimicrobiaceae bacterium]